MKGGSGIFIQLVKGDFLRLAEVYLIDDPSLEFAGNSDLEIRAFLGADLTFCHDKPAPPLSVRQMPLSA